MLKKLFQVFLVIFIYFYELYIYVQIIELVSIHTFKPNLLIMCTVLNLTKQYIFIKKFEKEKYSEKINKTMNTIKTYKLFSDDTTDDIFFVSVK